MELVFLLLTILGIIIALIFGYLQVVVPFIKGEVRFSKRFPFVETAEVSTAKPHRRKKKKRTRVDRALIDTWESYKVLRYHGRNQKVGENI